MMLRDKTVSLAVYDDHPKVIYDVAVHDNHIDVVDTKHEKQPEARRINRSYMEEVVAHPEEYIKNPAKIDWDWLHDYVENT
jgi:hypothetical protein